MQDQEQTVDYGIFNGTYDVITAFPMVKQTLDTYDWVKHSNPYLENTLGNMEQRASGVAQWTGQTGATVTGVVNSGVETTKWALENGRNAVVYGGTMGLGAAVLTTQLGAQLVAGGANLTYDGVKAVHAGGRRATVTFIEKVHRLETVIWDTLEETKRVAKIPVDKAAEASHSVLDIVRVLVERALQVNVVATPEDTLRQRVTNIATAIATGLTTRANEHVIEPVSEQTRAVLDQLSRSFVLLDVMRQKREWVMERIDTLSDSVSNLKARFEAEARQMGTQPEVLLMNFIRVQSAQLRQQLEELKARGQERMLQLLGNGTNLELMINYLQDLDEQLGHAEDLYQVSERVLTEARQRMADLSQWTATLLIRPNPQQAVQQPQAQNPQPQEQPQHQENPQPVEENAQHQEQPQEEQRQPTPQPHDEQQQQQEQH